MSSFGSITMWLELVKRGDPAGAEKVWHAYFDKVVRLANRQLGATARAMADEEDIALSAFHSFFERAENDAFAKLNDRNDLWQLLALLTKRKACDLIGYNARKKRGALITHSLDAVSLDPDKASTAVAPDAAASYAEELVRLIALLKTEELQQIALLKLEGYTNAEIATHLDCVERTVERKLWMIRKRWETELIPD